MLTYRTGAAGAPSAAKAMGEHLLQQTLAPDMAVMAEYYAQGLKPPTAAAAAAARYAAEIDSSGMIAPDQRDATLDREVARLDEIVRTREGGLMPRPDLAVRALGAFMAAGLMDREAGLAALARTGIAPDATVGKRLDEAAAAALRDRDYSSATATPRRDMNPGLAGRLGIDTGRGLTAAEVANLLNGQRADGKPITGKQIQAATKAVGAVFAFDARRMPARHELAHVLAGRRADGTALAPDATASAVRRFQTALGATGRDLTSEQRGHILAGRTATGGDLTPAQFHERMDTSRSRIGYVDLTFSAPKSVSIAWAFAPTGAERAIIHQAHRDAIDSVMGEIAAQIGRARKGQGGRHGFEPGAIGWVSFEHTTSRPTVAVVRHDRQGEAYTELHTLKAPSGQIAGDMQLHTHTAVFNAVLTEEGRIGALDLAQLEGRVKEWGALYQAFLATNLRSHGVDMMLDPRTEMARVTTISESVTDHFSKRTMGGTAAARAYAARQGLDWDSLDANRKVGLLKQGVQDPRGAKSDDLSDGAAWGRAAKEIGYRHRSILRPGEVQAPLSHEARLEAAYQAALPIFDVQLQRRASVEGADARVAAAKGLIAAGIAAPADVNAITHAMRTRGVRHNGEATSLIWGEVRSGQGRPTIGITTALHEREEKALIAAARAASRDKSAALSAAQIAAGVARHPELEFASEHGKAQRAIMDQIGTGGRLGVAIGVAGAGKTTLLKPLVSAWHAEGRAIHGIALAWRQSEDLKDAGIPPQNTRAIEPFLRSIAKGRIMLDANAVVVVDEVGLLGTRQLNTLMTAQGRHGFQLVAIGDPKQMQSVEAGAVIDLLRHGLGEGAIPTLATSIRQLTADERETVLMFRNDQTKDAVARKAANETLRVVPGDYEEAVAGVVQLWEERRAANRGREGFTLTISALTNYDAHQISVALRQKRRALGDVGADRRTVQATDAGKQARTYDLALAEGDHVRLYKRTGALFLDTGKGGNIGQNGSVLAVMAVRNDGLVLRNKEGREGLVKWEALTSARNGRVMLGYGDVLTTNTSQGSTVTEHIFALPAGSRQANAFAAYTSGSRHRETSWIVTSDGAERAEITGRRPLGDKRTVRVSDVNENIARNFARQPERETAHALLERASNVRRGAVRQMQIGKHGLEQRELDGQGRATLARTFDRHRHDNAVGRTLQALRDVQGAYRSAIRRARDLPDDVRNAVRQALDHARRLRAERAREHTARQSRGRRR